VISFGLFLVSERCSFRRIDGRNVVRYNYFNQMKSSRTYFNGDKTTMYFCGKLFD